MKHIAILDIGKTNAKAILLDALTGKELAIRRRPNSVLNDGPYPHYDIDVLWQFFIESLREFAPDPGFEAISITTHGAAAALVKEDGKLALPVLDYEYEYMAEIRADYDKIRPDFRKTFSPRLSCGLNLGAQLHYLKTAFPDDFARAHWILTYPQYWAFRLTGMAAIEATSLGCHTDLWLPKEGTFSPLVDHLNTRDRLPPIRSAFDILGTVSAEIANEIGLSKPVSVYCGIHDSNASLLAHLMCRDEPFSVVSTGTWVVSFAVGGSLDQLDPTRDSLANIDAYGRAVPSARYMGGREFDLMTESLKAPPPKQYEKLTERVLTENIMVLPTAVKGSGPYPHSDLQWCNSEHAGNAERYVAACLYAALMTTTCLDLLKAKGPIIVEGPFSENAIYLQALASFSSRLVQAIDGSTGTAIGAALLAGVNFNTKQGQIYEPVSSLYAAYQSLWLRRTDRLIGKE